MKSAGIASAGAICIVCGFAGELQHLGDAGVFSLIGIVAIIIAANVN